GIAELESEVRQACAPLPRGGEKFVADVDPDHLRTRVGAGEGERDFARPAADVERAGERCIGGCGQQAPGQSREAAVGALPLGRPGTSDTSFPLGLVGHGYALLGCCTARRRRLRESDVVGWYYEIVAGRPYPSMLHRVSRPGRSCKSCLGRTAPGRRIVVVDRLTAIVPEDRA